MSNLEISKSDMAMIRASVHGQLNGADTDQFVEDVLMHLEKIGDPLQRRKNGFPHHSTGHVRAAITSVLARGK